MRRRAQNSNKQFLIGTAAMAFAVMAIVVIFLFLSAPHIDFSKKSEKERDLYQIEFAKGFASDSAVVYLNDILIWHDIVPSDTTKLHIHRFADENILMVSRSHDDAVSIFNLDKKAGRIILRKERDEVTMSILGW